MNTSIIRTDFDHYDDTTRRHCEQLQEKMLTLLPAKKQWCGDELWRVAVAELGNEDERYCRIYTCQQCKQMYHDDYSTNTSPDRDFCCSECEVDFLMENPEAEYSGDQWYLAEELQ